MRRLDGRTFFGYRHLALDGYGRRAAALAIGPLAVYLARSILVLRPIVTSLERRAATTEGGVWSP